jgi:hypothetical protein
VDKHIPEFLALIHYLISSAVKSDVTHSLSWESIAVNIVTQNLNRVSTMQLNLPLIA